MPVAFALLAVSNLSAGTPITAVPQVVARTRAQAGADDVTGVMVFDGAGFCLYLEGNQDAVLRCYEASAQDSRQTDVEAVFHGQHPDRRYDGFFTGYASAEGLPVSEQLRELDGPGAEHRFLELATEFDLNAPASATLPRYTHRG